MRRGFMYLGLFLMIPVTLALRAMKAFRRAGARQQWMPLAAGFAAVLGIMSAMFTVWFGFAYSVLWTIMLGMVTTMTDVLIASNSHAPQRGYQPIPRQRGFGRPMAIPQGA